MDVLLHLAMILLGLALFGIFYKSVDYFEGLIRQPVAPPRDTNGRREDA